ncbi:hypothetical protein FOL47_006266 [Perkinsus chesapeaki]|uniref:Uncharacterized protein n=1 Tax=Perkinsus chesapeaki TaxID=330153 RepID=A0A7J6LST7_PERCH|nr:hypothetical protein FOL47_006266 [Perkinsus chesapeaki]
MRFTIQPESLLWLLVSFKAVWSQRPAIGGTAASSIDGCVWIEGLGCELGYGGECSSYLSQVDATLLNTVDLTYYETLCRSCLWYTSQDGCEAVPECLWDGISCMYPKSDLRGVALSSSEYHSSFIYNEIQSHSVCNKIKEATLCTQTQTCIWSSDQLCIRDIWRVMETCCDALHPITERAQQCRNRSLSEVYCLTLSETTTPTPTVPDGEVSTTTTEGVKLITLPASEASTTAASSLGSTSESPATETTISSGGAVTSEPPTSSTSETVADAQSTALTDITPTPTTSVGFGEAGTLPTNTTLSV